MDPVILWYQRSDRATNGLLRLIRGCFEGFWLGLLSTERLAQIDEAYYSRGGQYTSASYNAGGLSTWEQAAVDRYFTDVKRIVVTSAGGGREVHALARAGYQVTGFEPHEGLTRFGNRFLADEGLDARIETSSRDLWPARDTGADGAIVGWGGYMLITPRWRRTRFLRDATEQLPEGAPILLSFFHREGADVRFRAASRMGGFLRRLRGREAIELGDALTPVFAHFFTWTEIERELTAANLDLVDFGHNDYGWAVARVAKQHREDREDG